MAAVKNAVGVDLEIAYEVGRRNVNESLHFGNAGVGNPDVKSAVLGDDGVDHGVTGVGIGHVESKGLRALEARRRSFGTVEIDIGHHHVKTACAECLGERRSDT